VKAKVKQIKVSVLCQTGEAKRCTNQLWKQ